MLKNARIAELTAPVDGSTNDLLLEQLADMRSQLNKKWSFYEGNSGARGTLSTAHEATKVSQRRWTRRCLARSAYRTPLLGGSEPMRIGGPQTKFGPRAEMGQFNRWCPSEPTTSFHRQISLSHIEQATARYSCIHGYKSLSSLRVEVCLRVWWWRWSCWFRSLG